MVRKLKIRESLVEPVLVMYGQNVLKALGVLKEEDRDLIIQEFYDLDEIEFLPNVLGELRNMVDYPDDFSAPKRVYKILWQALETDHKIARALGILPDDIPRVLVVVDWSQYRSAEELRCKTVL